MTNKTIFLKVGKEKPVRQFHPWIFSGGIAKIEGNPGPGEIVEVKDAKGHFLAYGYHNSRSQIALRLLERQETNPVDENWWRTKVRAAINRRQPFFDQNVTDAFRLVNAEADLLPGLIVDKYGRFIVLQSMTAGIDRVKSIIADAINQILEPAGIFERSDMSMRKLEGLEQSQGVLVGDLPPPLLQIAENGFRFLVDVQSGQKTGFYLDQRDNRKIAADYAKDKSILDCFAYTGGFGIYATAAGAKSVTCVDSSKAALDIISKNFHLNDIPIENEAIIAEDVFDCLRRFQQQGRQFEMIVLDPPKLAPTKTHIPKAQRAYKDMNLQAMKLLPRDGILVSFSCSSGISPELFQRILAWAAIDAGREVQILQHLFQSPDHPVRLSFPESHYLKGLICRVL